MWNASLAFRQTARSCRGVEQFVPLQGVAQLVVAEPERRRRSALVEAISRQSVLQQLPLISGNGAPEVVGGGY